MMAAVNSCGLVHGISLALRGSMLCSLALLVGCGGGDVGVQRANASGKVTWQGKPIVQGQITFQPEKGPFAQGPIKDGSYSVSGVPVGKCKVAIESFEEGPEVTVGPNKVAKSTKQVIPPIYNTNTTLEANIEAGKANEHNFDAK